MAVKIRLMRLGKKKQPVYRMVVIDSRKARNGRYIDALGRYEPRQDPSLVEIDNEKAVEWLKKGAQPTDRAKKVLQISGAWSLFKIARGEIHTVVAKTAPVVEPVVETEPLPAVEASEEVAEEVAEAVEAVAADVEEAVDAPADAGADDKSEEE